MSFEERFSEIQTDMISLCLDYVSDCANKVYIYLLNENGMIIIDYFYDINGMIVQKNRINEALSDAKNKPCDVSQNRQKKCLESLMSIGKTLFDLYISYEREIPTQVKIVYDVADHRVEAEYQYKSVLSENSDTGAYDMLDEWYEYIKTHEST